MNRGKLNRRITLVTPGEMTDDGLGGLIEGATTTRELWCGSKQLSMRESLLFGMETATANYRFWFDHYSVLDLTYDSRLVYEGRNFHIVSVDEGDEANNQLIVLANERKN